jgi:hypothetical protein
VWLTLIPTVGGPKEPFFKTKKELDGLENLFKNQNALHNIVS